MIGIRAMGVLTVAVAMLAGCGLQQDVGSEAPAGSAAPSQAPAIQGALLDGASFSWKAVRGHPLVVDFWGSWCAPCRAEQADINVLYARYAQRGVRFIGVDMRDDDASANAYRRDFSVPYQSVADTDEQISAAYDVAAPPTIVVVNEQGVIVDRFLGTVAGVSDTLDSLRH